MKDILAESWKSLLAAALAMGSFTTLLPVLFSSVAPLFSVDRYTPFVIFLCLYGSVPLLIPILMAKRWFFGVSKANVSRWKRTMFITLWSLLMLWQLIFTVFPEFFTLRIGTGIVITFALFSIVIVLILRNDILVSLKNMNRKRWLYTGGILIANIVIGFFSSFSIFTAQQKMMHVHSDMGNPYHVFLSDFNTQFNFAKTEVYLDSVEQAANVHFLMHQQSKKLLDRDTTDFSAYQKATGPIVDWHTSFKNTLQNDSTIALSQLNKNLSDLRWKLPTIHFTQPATKSQLRAVRLYLHLHRELLQELKQKSYAYWLQQTTSVLSSAQARLSVIFLAAVFLLSLAFLQMDQHIEEMYKGIDLATTINPDAKESGDIRRELRSYVYMLILLVLPLLRPVDAKLIQKDIFKQPMWFLPSFIYDEFTPTHNVADVEDIEDHRAMRNHEAMEENTHQDEMLLAMDEKINYIVEFLTVYTVAKDDANKNLLIKEYLDLNQILSDKYHNSDYDRKINISTH